MATSMYWPRPSTSRWRKAATTPRAQSAAGNWSPMVAPALVGGPSGKPDLAISPDRPWMMRSMEAKSASGPSGPYPVMEAWISRGFNSANVS